MNFPWKIQTFLLKLVWGPATVLMFPNCPFRPTLLPHWSRTFILIAKYRSLNQILHNCVSISSIILWVYFLYKVHLDMVKKKEVIGMTKTMTISYILHSERLWRIPCKYCFIYKTNKPLYCICTVGCVPSNNKSWMSCLVLYRQISKSRLWYRERFRHFYVVL